MIAYLEFDDKKFRINLANPVDISIPVRDGANNPNCYGADPVQFETIRSGNFVGSIREGGSVNHQKLHITPHGNGTHTECYSHITDSSDTINTCLKNSHLIGQLITVAPQSKPDGDVVITPDTLSRLLIGNVPEAVIIRTLPNGPDKLVKQYTGTNPPYLDHEAAAWLVAKGVEHLLIDLPSVDREVDGGKLASHHAFWNTQGRIRKAATITELIYVPSEIPDGYYLVNIQILNLEMDASPGKPVLFKLEEVS